LNTRIVRNISQKPGTSARDFCEFDFPEFGALVDDPFRSLVGELIRAGGCAKSSHPFFEFLWADFLRRRIKHQLVEKDFGTALVKALDLAKALMPRVCPVGQAQIPPQVEPR
jgi:hypothetical protein